jgi:hypothetical protein
MELVDTPELHPGCCVLTSRSSGPLVDTGLEVIADGRAYIADDVARAAGAAAGLITPQERDALAERVELLEAELDECQAELAKAAALIEEAEALRLAIAFTLERGVVVDKRSMRLGLRPLPGTPKPDLTKSYFAEDDPEETPA